MNKQIVDKQSKIFLIILVFLLQHNLFNTCGWAKPVYTDQLRDRPSSATLNKELHVALEMISALKRAHPSPHETLRYNPLGKSSERKFSVFLRKKQYPQAFSFCVKLIMEEPFNPVGWAFLHSLYHKTSQPLPSRIALAYALDLDPENPTLQYLLKWFEKHPQPWNFSSENSANFPSLFLHAFNTVNHNQKPYFHNRKISPVPLWILKILLELSNGTPTISEAVKKIVNPFQGKLQAEEKFPFSTERAREFEWDSDGIKREYILNDNDEKVSGRVAYGNYRGCTITITNSNEKYYEEFYDAQNQLLRREEWVSQGCSPHQLTPFVYITKKLEDKNLIEIKHVETFEPKLAAFGKETSLWLDADGNSWDIEHVFYYNSDGETIRDIHSTQLQPNGINSVKKDPQLTLPNGTQYFLHLNGVYTASQNLTASRKTNQQH